MSACTRGVAVAVNACTLDPGNRSFSEPSCRYSGRKSCPQWLMQWASSTAKARTSMRRTTSMNEGVTSRSGETKTSRKHRVPRPWSTSRRAAGVRPL